MADTEVKKLVDTSHIKQAIVDVENIYDEIEIDDMDLEEEDVETEDGETRTEHTFRYACPCGDRFRITLE